MSSPSDPAPASGRPRLLKPKVPQKGGSYIREGDRLTRKEFTRQLDDPGHPNNRRSTPPETEPAGNGRKNARKGG